jgi:type IV secretion system protein VirB6
MNISYKSNILTLIVFCVMALISVQIPVFCSSLSGGVGINGIVGSVAGTMGGMARLMKGSGKGKNSKIPKPPTGNNIAAG